MGKICTFFCQEDVSLDTEPLIEKQIRKLINDKNVDTFWIGGDGWFDIYVSGILQKLKQEYPYIKIILIVANPRQLEFQENKFPFDDFKYPEEVKSVPLEKAVFVRNYYMATNTDYIIRERRKTIKVIKITSFCKKRFSNYNKMLY